MPESLRRDTTSPQGDLGIDRDTKVEQLLVLGLDHYFAGKYEQAIHVWTRVLFVDRGHARARAYIERARSALAERQRESEELLHVGAEAFSRGEVSAARRLLSSAVESGGPREEALALLDRLDRLDPGVPEPNAVPTTRRSGRVRFRRERKAPRVSVRSPSLGTLPIVLLIGAAVAATYAAIVSFGGDRAWLPGAAPTPAPVVRILPEEPVPVPSASELALARARLLFERGHLHESMFALDGVRPGDALRPDADALRAVIQRALLSGTVPSRTSGKVLADARPSER